MRAVFSGIKLTALVRCHGPIPYEVQGLLRRLTPNKMTFLALMSFCSWIDELLQEHFQTTEELPGYVVYLFAHMKLVREYYITRWRVRHACQTRKSFTPWTGNCDGSH
jgi:hypothetical protein